MFTDDLKLALEQDEAIEFEQYEGETLDNCDAAGIKADNPLFSQTADFLTAIFPTALSTTLNLSDAVLTVVFSATLTLRAPSLQSLKQTEQFFKTLF